MTSLKYFSLICIVPFLIQCQEADETPDLTDNQSASLSQFSSAMKSALLAMEAAPLFEGAQGKLSKAISDEIKNCDRRFSRDNRGQITGATVTGARCPIQTRWGLQNFGDRTDVFVSYKSQSDVFNQILPVEVLSLEGERVSDDSRGGRKIKLRLKGSARDTSGESVSFEIQSEKLFSSFEEDLAPLSSFYSIRVSFKDFTTTGRVNNGQLYFINDVVVSPQSFENLFFILK